MNWNDHYFLVEEDFNVKLSFKCSIQQESIKYDEYDFKLELAIIDELEIIEE